MPNEVTKKDIDALNKRIDTLEKNFNAEIKRIEDHANELAKGINSHAGSINKLQDYVFKDLQTSLQKLEKSCAGD